MTPPAPRKLHLDRADRSLRITWADGAVSRISWPILRANCPSAGERHSREHSAGDPLAILAHVPSADLIEIHRCGNYAVQLFWADGHNAGIYTWEYLRVIAGRAMQEPAT